MNLKYALRLGFFVFVIVPGFLALAAYLSTVSLDSPKDTMKESVQLAVENEMPWWLEPLQFFIGISVFCGAAALIGIALLIKYGGLSST